MKNKFNFKELSKLLFDFVIQITESFYRLYYHDNARNKYINILHETYMEEKYEGLGRFQRYKMEERSQC